jgi:hypothetical protein
MGFERQKSRKVFRTLCQLNILYPISTCP